MDEKRKKTKQTEGLGPGTAGYTTSGAAYRGREVAANIDAAEPDEPGFGSYPGQAAGGLDPEAEFAELDEATATRMGREAQEKKRKP